jgi:cell division protein FtsI (penicillin-binding protein 3)
VTRPATGEILALAAAPSFSPNRRDASAQTVNYATRLQFEPGSIFKVFSYAAVLDLGLVTMDERVDCENGRWRRPVGNGKYDLITDDHKMLGFVPLEVAFGHSLNTVAAKLALRAPAEQLVAYFRNFGFGEPTGLGLGYEDRGWVKDPAITTGAYRWDSGTHPRLGFGYTMQVTPMQLAMALGAVANGGILMKPLLVLRIEQPDGTVVRELRPQQVRRVIQPDTARLLTYLMRQVVTEGTGKRAALDEWAVAGKTGTTRKYIPELRAYSDQLYYGSFFGFLPAEDPQIAVVIVVDEPSTRGYSYYGGTAAGPIFAEISRGAASYLGIKPSPPPKNSATNVVVPSLSAATPLAGRMRN